MSAPPLKQKIIAELKVLREQFWSGCLSGDAAWHTFNRTQGFFKAHGKALIDILEKEDDGSTNTTKEGDQKGPTDCAGAQHAGGDVGRD